MRLILGLMKQGCWKVNKMMMDSLNEILIGWNILLVLLRGQEFDFQLSVASLSEACTILRQCNVWLSGSNPIVCVDTCRPFPFYS